MSENRYTPTRLEWLVLNIQARIPMVLSQMRMLNKMEAVDDIRVFFSAGEPDTVIGTIRYREGIDGNVVKILSDEIEREVKEVAQDHGWNDWVKVKFD
jgi:hypothetical protein